MLETPLVTVNPDGSTTNDDATIHPDGSLANETISTTSADELTKTIEVDSTVDTIFDRATADMRTFPQPVKRCHGEAESREPTMP